MTLAQIVLSLASGSVVGLSLGLIGGGGSVLAVPLIVYVIGADSPHVAIGTSAVAVAISAVINLVGHARARNVKWPCAIVFALIGMAGAAIGAHVGKAVDGQRLLAAFGVLMVAVAGLMLRPRKSGDELEIALTRTSAARLLPPLAATGLGVGALSGFFGIGGGFLIVPGLIGATGMTMIQAVGSSLFSVGSFGATTAASYALDGLVDWRVAGLFIGGGIIGGAIGASFATHLSKQRGALQRVFAGIVFAVAAYMLYRSLFTPS